uniref:Uncharacterized protein n=1 Tax=Amphimedon queenslandica TaxID=400682 RepID=A0A1X7SMM9_AMPQE
MYLTSVTLGSIHKATELLDGYICVFIVQFYCYPAPGFYLRKYEIEAGLLCDFKTRLEWPL